MFQPINNMGYLPERDIHGRYIWRAIREGLWPFKPRTINLYLEFDIDCNRYVLFAEVWFPDYSIRNRVDMNARDLQGDLYGATFKAAVEMLEGFRNREDFAVPPNVVLAEN